MQACPIHHPEARLSTRRRSTRRTSTRQTSRRRAFTLIELLVVMSVIAMLAGLLLPAMMNSRRAVRITEVTSDIRALEKAMADFKLRYGTEVPSAIRLCEKATDWNATDPITRRSRALIQKIWPDFDFTYSWPNQNPSGLSDGEIDINGDGDAADILDLNGTECLVFFLGGMCRTYADANASTEITGVDMTGLPNDSLSGSPATPKGWTPIGFSANPAFPFSRQGTSRVGPFHEFNRTRFTAVAGKAHNMPAYLDPIPGQQVPYAYANSSSSARGAQYNAADLDTGTTSSLSAIYTQGKGTQPNSPPYNPRGFQLISPGFDYTFGTGGTYDGQAITDPNRAYERDNIANFSGGELGG